MTYDEMRAELAAENNTARLVEEAMFNEEGLYKALDLLDMHAESYGYVEKKDKVRFMRLVLGHVGQAVDAWESEQE